MKIFQILNSFCHWDASNVCESLDDAKVKFAKDIKFVEAPDYVHEGWGFNPDKEGDARFIKPIPPEGWLYDAEKNIFYPEVTEEIEEPTETDEQITVEQALAELERIKSLLNTMGYKEE